MSRVPSLSSPFLLGFDEIERLLDRVAKGADLKNGLLSIVLIRPQAERIIKTIAISEQED